MKYMKLKNMNFSCISCLHDFLLTKAEINPVGGLNAR